jgi:pectate lyase
LIIKTAVPFSDMFNRTFSAFLWIILAGSASAQAPAFPGAEGAGKFARGGRGGKVIEVTNLNDNGPGSLRAAVESAEPRTVVFRVSGTIVLRSALRIRDSFITIAGQTAPGDGICIARYPLTVAADHVIVRYIRSRCSDEAFRDGVTGEGMDSLSVGQGRISSSITVPRVGQSTRISPPPWGNAARNSTR